MVKSRQLDVLMIILRDKKTKAKNIAEELEIHVRTVERNIEILVRMGIPIISTRGRNGGISIDEKYKIADSIISKTSYIDLALAINIYDSIFKGDFKERIINEIGIVNPDIISFCNTITNKFFNFEFVDKKIEFFDTSKEFRLEMLNNVREAIKKGYKINIKVKGMNDNLEVYPLSYVLRSNGGFLYGNDKEYILINTDKITKVEVCRDSKIIERSAFKKYNKDNIYRTIL
ncbi:MAG: helix-turn-helix transcriptional regulator [Clostridium sp.]